MPALSFFLRSKLVFLLLAVTEYGQNDQQDDQCTTNSIYSVNYFLVRLHSGQVVAARHTAVHHFGIGDRVQDIVQCFTAIMIIGNIILVEGVTCTSRYVGQLTVSTSLNHLTSIHKYAGVGVIGNNEAVETPLVAQQAGN